MANVIRLVQDVPQSLVLEAQKYAELSISTRTTSGSGSFIGTSNTLSYTAGTQDLYNQLDVIMTDYRITAIDWNLIRDFINGQGQPLLNNMQTKLIKVNGALSEVQLLKSDLTTLIAKTILNKTNGVLTSVTNYVYADNGISIVCQFVDTLNRVNGSLDNVVRTVVI